MGRLVLLAPWVPARGLVLLPTWVGYLGGAAGYLVARGLSPKVATHSLTHSRRQEHTMMGDTGSRFARTSNTTVWFPSHKQADKRRYMVGVQEGRRSQEVAMIGNKDPVPKLHKVQEGRQEEIMMGDQRCRSPETPVPYPVHKLQKGRHEESMMGDKNLRVPGTSRHCHPVPKLQEGRQEEIMMGDKNLRVPGTAGTTIRLPSYTSYKKGDGRIMMGDKTWRFPGTPGTTMSSLAQIQNAYSKLFVEL